MSDKKDKLISIINTSSFHYDNIRFKTCDFPECKIVTLDYCYDKNVTEKLIIETEFMNINRKSIFNKSKFEKTLIIDLSMRLFDGTIADLLLKYDNDIDNFIKNKFGNCLCKKKLVKNKDGFVTGIIKHNKYLENYSKIINYNISNKYKAIESYDIASLNLKNFGDLFNRIMKDKKQMRLLMAPQTIISDKDKQYKSYLNIYLIEVKYENAKIDSIIDKNVKEGSIEIDIEI